MPETPQKGNPASNANGDHEYKVLREVIARLEDRRDEEKSGEVWGMVDKNDTNNIVSTLQRLRGARRCLDLLRGSLDNKLSTLETCIAESATSRIRALTDETLALIFSIVCDDGDQKAPERLFHVCRRFQSIFSRIPRLWTTVDSSMPGSMLELRTSLSKELPLSVSLLPHHDPVAGLTWASFLNTAGRHNERWRTLFIDIGNIREKAAAFRGRFMGVITPLESLTIIYASHAEYNKVFDAQLQACLFTSLKSLRTSLHFPRVTCLKSLTECTLHSLEFSFNVVELMEFLASTPGSHVSERDLQGYVPSGISDNGGNDRLGAAVFDIMDAVIMLNVEQINISVHYHDVDEDEDDDSINIANAMAIRYRFQSFKHFSYSCICDPDYRDTTISIPLLMNNFPKLEGLAFHTPSHDFS